MLFYSKEMKQIKKAQELNKIEEYLDKLKEHDATWIQQEITHNTICKLKAKIKNQEGKIIKFSKPEKNEYTTTVIMNNMQQFVKNKKMDVFPV